ncbi:hypothetical protein D3C81_1939440 [compost metagenome]
MLLLNQRRQLRHVDPLQTRHAVADLVAVDTVDHAAGDFAAQRFLQNAAQITARGAVDTALLAVIIKKVVHRIARVVHLHAVQPRHGVAE